MICFFSNGELFADERGFAKIHTYREYLVTLDKTRMESILKAKDALITNFKDARESEADEALRAFRDFHLYAVRELDLSFYKNREYQHAIGFAVSKLNINAFKADILGAIRDRLGELPRDTEKEKIQALEEIVKFKDYGINIVYGEGDWYLAGDSQFLIQVYSQFNTTYAEYYVFKAQEDMERIAHDAALIVPWETIRKRLIRWEEFLAKHPEAEEENEIAREIDNLLRIYLCGMDNTPAYYLWSGPKKFDINKDLAKSYEAFIAENKGSEYYPIINQVYLLLKRNNFKLTGELISYLDSVGRNCREFRRFM